MPVGRKEYKRAAFLSVFVGPYVVDDGMNEINTFDNT